MRSERKRFSLCLLWVVLVLGLLPSCGDDQLGEIPEEDFESMVSDLALYHSSYRKLMLTGEVGLEDTVELYAPYFDSVGYSREAFESTLMAYMEDGEAFDDLLDQVIARLQRRLEGLEEDNRTIELQEAIDGEGLSRVLRLDSLQLDTAGGLERLDVLSDSISDVD